MQSDSNAAWQFCFASERKFLDQTALKQAESGEKKLVDQSYAYNGSLRKCNLLWKLMNHLCTAPASLDRLCEIVRHTRSAFSFSDLTPVRYIQSR